MPGIRERDRLIEHVGGRGIRAAFHYQPLHLSKMGRRLAPECGPLPVTEDAANRLVRLPLFHALSEEQQEQVIEAVIEFRP